MISVEIVEKPKNNGLMSIDLVKVQPMSPPTGILNYIDIDDNIKQLLDLQRKINKIKDEK